MNTKHCSQALGWMALLCLLCVGGAAAQKKGIAVGRVAQVLGLVEIQSAPGSWTLVKEQQLVQSGTKLRSHLGSKLLLQFGPNASLGLDGRAKVWLGYAEPARNGWWAIRMRVNTGKVWGVAKQQYKGPVGLWVETPSASALVWDGHFELEVSETGTSVSTLQGETLVRAAAGGRKKRLRANTMTIVHKGQKGVRVMPVMSKPQLRRPDQGQDAFALLYRTALISHYYSSYRNRQLAEKLRSARSLGRPHFTLSLTGGTDYSDEIHILENPYPYQDSLTHVRNWGPTGDFNLGLDWEGRLSKQNLFRVGSGYWTDEGFHGKLFHQNRFHLLMGWIRQLSAQGDNVAVSYDWSKNGFMDATSFGNRIDLTLQKYGQRGMALVSTGYELTLLDNAEIQGWLGRRLQVQSHDLSVNGNLIRWLNQRIGINLLAHVTGYIADNSKWQTEQPLVRIYVYDVQAEPVLHAGDSLFLDTLDALDILKPLVFKQHGDSLSYQIEQQSPSSNISLQLSTSLSFILPGRATFNLGVMDGLSWYPQPYVWHNLHITQEELSGDIEKDLSGRFYVAQNRKDGLLYWARELTDLAHEAYVGPFVQTSKTRIDNAAVLNFSLEQEIWRLGTLVMGGEISWNWSSLGDEVPVRIPRRSSRMFANWTKQIQMR